MMGLGIWFSWIPGVYCISQVPFVNLLGVFQRNSELKVEGRRKKVGQVIETSFPERAKLWISRFFEQWFSNNNNNNNNNNNMYLCFFPGKKFLDSEIVIGWFKLFDKNHLPNEFQVEPSSACGASNGTWNGFHPHPERLSGGWDSVAVGWDQLLRFYRVFWEISWRMFTPHEGWGTFITCLCVRVFCQPSNK